MFRRSYERGRMSHAYLFVGAEGIGKQTFARLLAKCLLCECVDSEQFDACGQCGSCKMMDAATHPDYLTVACPEGKTVLPLELIAGTDEQRGRSGLCHDLSLRPMVGTRRIAVIDDAHCMNTESANALLKTLEEPPSFSMLILIATAADAVLPTIRSRCQEILFQPLAIDDLSELLVEHGSVDDATEARALAALSDGSLATASELNDSNLRGLRDNLYEAVSSGRFQSPAVTKHLTEGLEELGNDRSMQRRGAAWLIRFLAEFLRRSIAKLSDHSPTGDFVQVDRFIERIGQVSPADKELLLDLLDRSHIAMRQLDANMSVALCLEGLFDDVGRSLRELNRHSVG